MYRLLIHPVFVHFPIALLFFSLVLDTIGAVRKRSSYLEASYYCQIGGVIGGLIAVASGFLAGRVLEMKRLTWLPEAIKTGTEANVPEFVDQARRVLEMHTLAGLYGVGIFVVLLFWRIRWKEQLRGAALTFYLAASIIGFGLLTATGWLGGVLGHELGPRVVILAPGAPR